MVAGCEVEFKVRKSSNGPRPNATDVVALERKVA
jgi:hypothetical protein